MEITLKKETLLGLETYDILGFNSEDEHEFEISKLIKIRPEFEKTQIKFIDRQISKRFD